MYKKGRCNKNLFSRIELNTNELFYFMENFNKTLSINKNEDEGQSIQVNITER